MGHAVPSRPDRTAEFLGPHVASLSGGVVCGDSMACSARSAEKKGVCQLMGVHVCLCVWLAKYCFIES